MLRPRKLVYRLLVSLSCLSGNAGCRFASPEEQVFIGKRREAVDAAFSDTDFDASTSTLAFSRTALLEAIAVCTIRRIEEFEGLATALAESAHAYQQEPIDQKRDDAKAAWRRAIATWQKAELFSFGPAARGSEPGGANLRDQIYAWPLINRCKIEEQLVEARYAAEDFSSTLINTRGLGAIEYLLFHQGNDNACSEFSVINADGTWSALTPQVLRERKAAYASAAANLVSSAARALSNAWNPVEGNFRSQFVGAGTNNSVFESDQDAFDSVNHALFYLEIEVKDLKLARPLGYADCFETVCPDAVESPWAQASTEHLRANLNGFRQIFMGCGDEYAGPGFDDWLAATGASDLSHRMTSALARTSSAISLVNVPIEQAVVTDLNKVEQVYVQLKSLTDLLKSEFISVLNLELPTVVEGDND